MHRIAGTWKGNTENCFIPNFLVVHASSHSLGLDVKKVNVLGNCKGGGVITPQSLDPPPLFCVLQEVPPAVTPVPLPLPRAQILQSLPSPPGGGGGGGGPQKEEESGTLERERERRGKKGPPPEEKIASHSSSVVDFGSCSSSKASVAIAASFSLWREKIPLG